VRRNSGDEEIRRLHKLAGQGDWRAAEKLAAELKRRAEPDPRTEFRCPGCDQSKRDPEEACVIEALAEVVADRILDDEDLELSKEEIGSKVMEWLSRDSAPDWWQHQIGPVIDVMEADFRNAMIESPEGPTEAARSLAADGSEDWDERRRNFVIEALRNIGRNAFDPPILQDDFDLDEMETEIAIQAIEYARDHSLSRADRRLAQELLDELTP